MDLLVVSGSSQDEDPSVILTNNRSYYIFQLPDSFARSINNFKIRFSKFKAVCSTSTVPNSLCIVPFFASHVQFKNFPIILTNTSEISHIRYFFESRYLNFTRNLTESYEDDFITISKIELTKSVAFNVKCKEIPKQFVPNLAKQLGVNVKGDFVRLKKGSDVVLSNGTVVTPDMVFDDGVSEENILFVDIKDDKDFELLPDLSSFSVIVHFTRISTLLTETYQSFFVKAAPHCYHISFKKEKINSFLSSRNYDAICKLANIGMNRCAVDEAMKIDNPFIHFLSNKDVFNVSSKTLKVAERQKEECDEVVEGVLPQIDSITILGTNCNSPDLNRGVSCYLLRTRKGFVMFDCGYGSVCQIYRKFGEKVGNEIISSICCVWCSHWHYDHTYGLANLLYLRKEKRLDQNELILILPQNTYEMFTDIVNVYEISNVVIHETKEKIVINDSITILSTPVTHDDSFKCYACKAIFDDNLSFVFSGDRLAIGNRIDDVFGSCDILLHESTYFDQTHAEKYNHSTKEWAIEEGKKLNSKFTILTHFSVLLNSHDMHTDEENVIFARDFITIPFNISKENFLALKIAIEKFNTNFGHQ